MAYVDRSYYTSRRHRNGCVYHIVGDHLHVLLRDGKAGDGTIYGPDQWGYSDLNSFDTEAAARQDAWRGVGEP
jgi:hypothetical protein